MISPAVLGVPFEFVFFAATLIGVALFHRYTLAVALSGLTVISAFKVAVTGFNEGQGVAGLTAHLAHEWVILSNLFLLLVGFALLARHFEKSHLPDAMARILPDNWLGAFWMLVLVFVLSAFLDNIAAAMIGGAMAQTLFRGKVHIGFLAAIVAASNAGGAGSVVGDTTTTMMWIDGVSPIDVLHAYVASIAALLIFGIPASLQQQRYSPIVKDAGPDVHVDTARLVIVGFILVAAVATNITVNLRFAELSDALPFLGLSVAAAVLLTAGIRKPDWEIVPEAAKGSIFLLALVLCATMMPVEKLPAASWQTAFGLGFVSSVFDNIPLTALALRQGGYDWGALAFAVGFGGSMIWFGSSAGIAVSNLYPEARSVGLWLKHGWHVAAGYVVGFFVLLAILGWQPHAPHRPVPAGAETPAAVR